MAADLEQKLQGEIRNNSEFSVAQPLELKRLAPSRGRSLQNTKSVVYRVHVYIYSYVLVINHVKNDKKNHLNQIIKAISYSHMCGIIANANKYT